MTEHPGSLRKRKKFRKNTNIEIQQTYIMCPHKVSINIKFEGSSWKIDSKNAKNA